MVMRKESGSFPCWLKQRGKKHKQTAAREGANGRGDMTRLSK